MSETEKVANAVSALTGMSRQELDDLGGFEGVPKFPAELKEAAHSAALIEVRDYPRNHTPQSIANAVLAAVHDDIVQAERERIARAIEAEASDSSFRDPYEITGALLEAAKIARGIARGTGADR